MLPVPPSVEVTVTLLFLAPAVVPVTLSEIVQEAPAASVPPLNDTEPLPATAVVVPVQVPLTPFGVATTKPAGRLSVNATPLNATPELGFVIVKLSDVVPFNGIVSAPNTLLILGGEATVRVAVAVLPVPPFVEVTAPVVLVNTPDVVPVMVTLNTQVPLAATVAPVKLITFALMESVPPQTVDVVLAAVKPVGKGSVNATPVKATVGEAFVIVNVRLLVPLRTIVVGLKTSAIEGGPTTVTDAVAVPPVPPSVEVIVPVVLFCTPAVVPVTFTEKVQDVLAAKEAPDKLIEFPPAAAVIVPPPQLPVSPFGVETVRPEGNVSVKAIPVRAVPRFGLAIVKLKEVEPFSGIVAAPNTF